MKLDIFYILGLILALLAEVLSLVLPVHTPELAAFFFLIYMIGGMKPRFNRAFVVWMLGVLVFFALSTAWSLDSWWCFWGLRQMVIVFIGMLATYSYLSSSPGNIKKVLKIYLAVSFILIVFVMMNVGQLDAGVRLGQQVDDKFGEEQTLNSNLLAINLCYALYAGFVIISLGKKSKLIRVVALMAAVFVLYLILMTGSRKAIILLLLPVVIFPLLSKSKGKKMLMIPVGAAVVALGGYLIMIVPSLYDVLGSRVEDLLNIVSGETSGGEDISRAVLIEYGIEWFLQKPLFGYGINNFRVLSNNTYFFAGRNFFAHNNYVELLVDVGLVGFLIYYSCYYYFWKRLKGHFSENNLNKWILILIIAHLFLDIAMVSYYSFSSNLILCLCFYAAAISRENNMKLNTNVHEASRHHQTL